jgi:hypothetical protein
VVDTDREEQAVTRDASARGDARRKWIGGVAFAAIFGLLLAGVAVRAGDADARVAKPWTRTLQPHWSSQQLGLPASAAPRRLGRARPRRL